MCTRLGQDGLGFQQQFQSGIFNFGSLCEGEVPEEDNKKSDNITQSKNAELEQMRKSKRQHRDHFKMMEAGKLPEQKTENKRRGDTKLLVGKLKDVSTLYTLTYLIFSL